MASHDPLDNNLLLGRYRVVQLLGEGGMGTVHLARVEGAEGFTRPVVVKRMRRDIRTSDEGNRLFIREAKILSKMQHPGIVGISDFGVEDGAHIMVLEYVHGYSLCAWLDYRHAAGRPLPVDICLFIVRRILDALHYAHHFDTEEGQEIEIVHRDISPDNVLMSNRGYVHLLDFGVASMRGPLADNSTQEGVFRGKLGYAAPETIQGQPATPSSDQYSSAVVLLEMLTHETPFLSESMGETVVRMVNEIPEAPSNKRNDIPPGLDEALARALAKQPGDRFESALDFSRTLRKLQQTDDEELAQQLKELVREDFEALPHTIEVEALKLRDAALARKFSPLPPGGIPPGGAPAADAVPIQPNTNEVRLAAAEEPPAALLAARRPPAASQVKGLLWGLLLVGGLIALGLGAAVALLAQNGEGSEVVVVGGERLASAPESASEGPATRPPVADASSDEPAGPLTQAAPKARAAKPPNRTPKPKRKPAPPSTPTSGGKNLQSQLSMAVQQKGFLLQKCFSADRQAGGTTSQATLHFSVPSEGGAARVEVEPSALASTPLGSCLGKAARQVQFPKLPKAVAFRVPVRASVASTTGPK